MIIHFMSLRHATSNFSTVVDDYLQVIKTPSFGKTDLTAGMIQILVFIAIYSNRGEVWIPSFQIMDHPFYNPDILRQ